MSEWFEMPDRNLNTTHVRVEFDPDTKTFVAAIRGGRYHRMMDGSTRQMVLATAEAAEAAEAASKAMKAWNERSSR
jgi:hypothetical protein|tara:strand:+ start:169 stop:396 length:228 start_codon:yes stop_codon:yes gene_type:complete